MLLQYPTRNEIRRYFLRANTLVDCRLVESTSRHA